MSFRQDPLFKGCTRPAMLFGVPLTPLSIVIGSVILLSIYIKLLLLLSLVPLVFMMRLMTQVDDQQFRLLGLMFRFRVFPHRNANGAFWGASAYSPLRLKRRSS